MQPELSSQFYNSGQMNKSSKFERAFGVVEEDYGKRQVFEEEDDDDYEDYASSADSIKTIRRIRRAKSIDTNSMRSTAKMAELRRKKSE